MFAVDDFFHQLVVAQFPHSSNRLWTLNTSNTAVRNTHTHTTISLGFPVPKVYLRVHQPAVVQRDVQQVEHDALGRVLEVRHAGETHVDVQPRGQLREDGHGVAHVLRRHTAAGQTAGIYQFKSSCEEECQDKDKDLPL